MQVVYLLRSVRWPQHRYVGCTGNLRRRLEEHQSGRSVHTNKYRPWRVAVAVAFADRGRALAFEEYLKSGSGSAFARCHFW